jgi:hypothetical protein
MEIELELGGVEIEVKIEGVRGAVTLLGISALAAAVVKEMRTPPNERQWHGALFGVIPYDLRPPTPERVRTTLWDRSNPSVLVPTLFGVGWTVNLAALADRCGCLPTSAAEPNPTPELTPQVPLRSI